MMKKPDTHRRTLKKPGARNPAARIQEMLRVDHAGEYGAVRIYAGQRAVFRHLPHKRGLNQTLEEMERGEQVHLEQFRQWLPKRQVRPTALLPLWHIAGYVMGAATALMGEKAAMACTEAVEDVIEQHYQTQIDELSDNEEETELRETLTRFREEELAHHETAVERGARETPGYQLLSGLIKNICRTAIRISEKI